MEVWGYRIDELLVGNGSNWGFRGEVCRGARQTSSIDVFTMREENKRDRDSK